MAKISKKTDEVNHPKHYNSDPSGIECIDVTRHRNFNVGNAIKYLWRAGLKPLMGVVARDDDKRSIREHGEIQDLNKAVWYLVDEIHRLGGTCNVATDVVNTCLPLDRDSIVEAAMNYREFVNDREYTICGISNNSDIAKENIRGALKKILYNEYDKAHATQTTIDFEKK